MEQTRTFSVCDKCDKFLKLDSNNYTCGLNNPDDYGV